MPTSIQYRNNATGQTGELESLLRDDAAQPKPTISQYNGVPVFLPDKFKGKPLSGAADLLFERSQASGSLGGDNPEAFLTHAEQAGWRPALEKLFGPTSPGMLRAISPNRTAWAYLFDINEKSRVLDLGAGTGGVSCRLAQTCNVVSADKSKVNSAFVRIRGEQENLPNFQSICTDAVDLPFADEQFDLVCMIGSFEWVPSSWPEEDPESVHRHALEEVFRVLKPGGNIFLAIENRNYLGYVFGIQEPHTHLKHVAYLDRERANQLSLDIRNKPFVEYTYSRDECHNLLQGAGFDAVKGFWLRPDYSTPHYIIPLENDNILKYFIEERLNPWDFQGPRSLLYRLYRMLPPSEISNHVEFYGFRANKPE